MLLYRYSLGSGLLLVLSLAIARAIATKVVINNTIALPIAKRFNFTGSATILQHDQARARSLRARALARGTGILPVPSPEVSSVPAENQLVQYTVIVKMGSPPTEYELIVDIGSSNTWVGAGDAYMQKPSTRATHNEMALEYGNGAAMAGVEIADTVMLGVEPGLSILGQFFGSASRSAGFDGVDGILGLGPTDLTVGTLNPDSTVVIPTVTDNLFAQAAIASEIVSISFEPTTSKETINGELTFGGTDTSKFIGQMIFAPITSTSPSSQFFGIQQSVRYAETDTLLKGNPGIFDTGTTLLLLATDALDLYVSSTGAVFDDTTGLYRINPTQFAHLQSMFFTINGITFEFTANAQIWPRNLNSLIGGSSSFVYLIVADIGTRSGSGMDFINGMTFMERFYTVFDTGNNRVGIANTPFTTATTN
ncbi:aspartic peptidase A1 [Cubamyces lactineus]|nr:aspartic peptidase A1 [Cubamyces lactineus]